MAGLWIGLKEAWGNRAVLGDDNKTRELAAFLPAALEIQSSPPNPLAKWVGRCLSLLFVLLVVWACVGEVNVVASAEGKIIPSARVKEIQPLQKSVVKRILVQDGELVIAGQPLLELDATLTRADANRLASELRGVTLKLAVSEALMSLMSEAEQTQALQPLVDIALPPVKDATPPEHLLHQRLLLQQWQDFRARVLALQSAEEKMLAEQAASGEVIAKLEQTLPIVAKRAETLKALMAKQYAAENDYLQLEQNRIELTRDLAAEQQRLNQIKAATQEVRQQQNSLLAQARAEQLSLMTDLQRQQSSLQEELVKAQDLNARQILYAPVAGQVQQLAVNTVGGVVTDAQVLMLVVPTEGALEVEVFLENKDIGFVREGMPAEIKLHTFPFTKYGVIEGEVVNVSDDAIVDEQRGLVFSMRVKLTRNSLWVDTREVPLQPGMAATAEVQTDKRKIIEFLTSPMRRVMQEGLRER
jgi:hemolysin D